MKIVRPYGFSRTDREGKTLERRLVEVSATKPWPIRDIPAFALQESQLVIGQWISLIDKIARKPNGQCKPTAEQRRFRHRLGQACWKRLLENKAKYLPKMVTDEELSRLSNLWRLRVHPYRDGERTLKPDKTGKLPDWAKIEGRLYKEFAESTAPAHADTEAIARKIEAKLYGEGARKGLIATRAESIKGNVLRLRTAGDCRPQWRHSPQDLAAYQAPGDPVKLIRAKAEEIEATGGRMSHGEAAAILHEHWAKVFLGEDGAVLSVTQAKNNCADLVALHDALRLCYRGLLKRTRKDTRKQRQESDRKQKASPKLSVLLPRTLDEGLGLVGRQGANAKLAELVRLGKINHYASPRDAGDADHPALAVDNWPQGWTETDTTSGQWLRDVETSDFWTSDGQAEIKRAEAFVRMWRQALTLARWTLTDWVSMKEPFRKDIFGGGGKDGGRERDEALAPSLFKRCIFDEKLELLFGARAKMFALGDDEDCQEFLRSLIDGGANVRHAAFHFKGRQDLLDALRRLPDNMTARPRGDRNEIAMAIAEKLWEADATGRLKQLRETLVGAHAEAYLTQEQADQVLPLLARTRAVELPLPRFSLTLRRRENAWKRVRLPDAPNRTKLEAEPERHCQYTISSSTSGPSGRGWPRAARTRFRPGSTEPSAAPISRRELSMAGASPKRQKRSSPPAPIA